MKHNLTESYLQSLTEQQRINEMKEWTASEWQQYYCPKGTISLEEFRQILTEKVDELILKKYGSNYALNARKYEVIKTKQHIQLNFVRNF